MTINSTATLELTLDGSGLTGGPAMGVAYHPVFDQYYSGTGNNVSVPASVWDSSGNLLQATASGIDHRGFHYNPNTGNLEVVSFAPANADSARGLFALGLDGSGLITGPGTNTAQTKLPGIPNSQSTTAYDAGNDVLYAKTSNTDVVTVLDRASGNASGNIVLDLIAAGVTASDLNAYSVGFDDVADVLFAFDATNDDVLAFGLDGSFLGASSVAADIDTFYRVGYANGLAFVYDNGDYLGFKVLSVDAVPEPAAMSLLGLGLAGFGWTRRKVDRRS